jgi:transposase
VDKRVGRCRGWLNGSRCATCPSAGGKAFSASVPNVIAVRIARGGPTTTQELGWDTAKSSHTKAYEKYLLLQWVHATVEDVSLKEEIGYKALAGLVDRWISREGNWAEGKGRQILGLEESALKQGHRDFVVSVTARAAQGEGRILAVLPERQKETVKAFVASLPQGVQRASRTVCTALYEGFIPAVKEVLGHAPVVADRYQVAKL